MSDATADPQSSEATDTENLIPDTSELFKEERAAAEKRLAAEEHITARAQVVSRRRYGSDGPRWGDDIPERRQRELDERLAAWDAETDHGDRKGPFDGEHLTGADVYYLVARTLIGTTQLFHRELIADLDVAREVLRDPNLDPDAGDMLNLNPLHLEGAFLAQAQLERAILSWAHLSGASLWRARLGDANLQGAELTGAALIDADLTGADLRFARFDRNTHLNQAKLHGVSLDQTVLDSTNLTVTSWESVAPLGDDKRARESKGEAGQRKYHQLRIDDYEAAVRANRLLATALRAQGLSGDADIFAYRAQLMERGLRFQRRQFGRWLTSWGLAAMAGYGYRLWRIFAAYGLVLAVFALIFWMLGVHSFADASAEPWYQALWDSFLVSLSAIHGRAVFEQLGAWTPAAWVAAIESVVGIVIEGVFVAMLIQRLFR